MHQSPSLQHPQHVSCGVTHPSSAPDTMCSSLISWMQSMEPLQWAEGRRRASCEWVPWEVTLQGARAPEARVAPELELSADRASNTTSQRSWWCSACFRTGLPGSLSLQQAAL